MIALKGHFRWTLLSSFDAYMCKFMRHIRPKMAQRQTRLWINTLVSSKLDCFKHIPEHFSSFAGWFAVKFITFELTLDIYVEFQLSAHCRVKAHLKVTWPSAITWLRLTRAPLGGGLFRAPPLVFLRYLLNQCRYHHQTCSTLSPNNFTHCVKILKSRVL